MSRQARRRLLIAVVVVVVAFAGGVIWLVRSQGSYYRQVGQLSSGMNGKSVQVGGTVMRASLLKGGGTKDTMFRIKDLTGSSAHVWVSCNRGVLPTTFGEGVQVVVRGTYHYDGNAYQNFPGSYIEATEVQTKCPSKYKNRVSPAASPASQ